jgi:hypothetical protein
VRQLVGFDTDAAVLDHKAHPASVAALGLRLGAQPHPAAAQCEFERVADQIRQDLVQPLAVESTPGQGSTFSFTIPAVRHGASAPDAASALFEP